MEITSFENLKEYAKGAVIELPAFAPDMPFVARLKQVDIADLIKHGKIPNPLMDTVNDMFYSQNSSGGTGNTLENTVDVVDMMTIFAREALIQPTMDEIEEAGMKLSMAQLSAIFQFTQGEVQNLKSFRTE